MKMAEFGLGRLHQLQVLPVGTRCWNMLLTCTEHELSMAKGFQRENSRSGTAWLGIIAVWVLKCAWKVARLV